MERERGEGALRFFLRFQRKSCENIGRGKEVEGVSGGAYLAKPDSAKSESAVQERAKPYLAKPGN